jgi:hypothetical protein
MKAMQNLSQRKIARVVSSHMEKGNVVDARNALVQSLTTMDREDAQKALRRLTIRQLSNLAPANVSGTQTKATLANLIVECGDCVASAQTHAIEANVPFDTLLVIDLAFNTDPCWK